MNSNVSRQAVLIFMAALPLLLIGFLIRSQPSIDHSAEPLTAYESLIAEVEARRPSGPELSFRWELPENSVWTAHVRTVTATTEESIVRFIIGERTNDGWLVFIDGGEDQSALIHWGHDGWIRRNGRTQEARPWIFRTTGIWIPDTQADRLRQDSLLQGPPMHQSAIFNETLFHLNLTAPSVRLNEHGGSFWQSATQSAEVIACSVNTVGGPLWSGTHTQVVRGSVRIPNGWLKEGSLEYRNRIDLTDGAQSRAAAAPIHHIKWNMKRVGSACFDTSAPSPQLETNPRQPSR